MAEKPASPGRRPSFGAKRSNKTKSPIGCCGYQKRSHKISPVDTDIENHPQIIEVRPGRFLRVKHIVPDDRVNLTKNSIGQLGSPHHFASSGSKKFRFLNGLEEDSSSLQHPNAVEENVLDTSSNNFSDNVMVQEQFKAEKAYLGTIHIQNTTQTDSNANSSNNRVATASNVSMVIKPSSSITNWPTEYRNPSLSAHQTYTFKELRQRESKLSIATIDSHIKDSPKNGINIFRNTVNNASHKAVIFCIHGVAGSSDVWQAQTDYFSERGYVVVAPDLIGHGFSSSPRNPDAYSFSEISADLCVIFDQFRQKRNIVIGHSYGSCFATILARKRWRHVEKLILVSGGGPTPLNPQPGVFSLPSCFLSCVRPCLICTFKRNAFHGNTKTYIPKEKAFDVPTYVLKYTMNGQHWLDGDEDFHKALVVPTLLVYGEDDQLVSLEEELVMEQTIHGSRLVVIHGASHMVMMEKPAQVNQLMHEFIDKAAFKSTNLQQEIITSSNQSLDNMSLQDLS